MRIWIDRCDRSELIVSRCDVQKFFRREKDTGIQILVCSICVYIVGIIYFFGGDVRLYRRATVYKDTRASDGPPWP